MISDDMCFFFLCFFFHLKLCDVEPWVANTLKCAPKLSDICNNIYNNIDVQ